MTHQATLRTVLEANRSLTRTEAADLMRAVLDGEVESLQLAALLGVLNARGATSEEIAGFAQVLRAAAVALPLTAAERDELVDTCGTGGDGAHTFNISTAAALVAAGAGAKVAKHGNRAVSSRCGSADVLEALGIPITLEPAAAADCLRQHNFCFLLAPAHHPGLQAVAPVRRALGVRTIFNVLGPLLNPAGARRQVMGVYASDLVAVVGRAMALLGVEQSLVVHGTGGLDELSLAGPSRVAWVRSNAVDEYEWHPGQFGLREAPLEALAGGDARHNATVLESIFAGQPGPARDVVLLNAAAVLLLAGQNYTLSEAVQRAAHALDAGAVRLLVEKLRGLATRVSL